MEAFHSGIGMGKGFFISMASQSLKGGLGRVVSRLMQLAPFTEEISQIKHPGLISFIRCFQVLRNGQII